MEEQAKKNFIVNAVFIAIWVSIILVAGKFLLRYLFPFVLAVCVAALMQGVAEKLSGKIRLKKGVLAAILSAVLYIAVAAVLIFVILKIFSFTGKALSSISDLSAEASELIAQAERIFSGVLRDISPEMEEAGKKILSNIFFNIAEKLSVFLSDTAANIVKAAPSFLFSSVVALAATCYIAKDFDGLMHFVKNMINEKTGRALSKVKNILKTCVFKMLTGYIFLMLITFIELLFGFFVLRVRNAVLIALVIALVDILPVLGAGAVLLPWGIFNIIVGNTAFGIGLMVLYLSVTVVRNFAEPKIVGGKMGINPLFILLTMFLGLRIFGFAGLIILPVTFIVVIKYYKSEMEQETS